jgi:hypothetical protein
MKDILQDIVSHTQNLGFLTTVKVTGTEKGTTINAMAEDRSVIMEAETAAPYADMVGVFGMPQLNKLKYLLDGNEYKVLPLQNATERLCQLAFTLKIKTATLKTIIVL